ncbi:glycosyltransferase [Ectobacillus antri]|uniref:glycosyltransferase n=1 Tax=Ectobacillus antri TaxID=2486280 RepID=UPI000F5A5DC3|nr:glycosyltransferase [Ectobacillus antri]
MRDVGIVMPVYKQDPVYLELALRSILEQSYPNFYFVIVSDGAPSDTVAVIERVTAGDPRVQILLKNQNEGVARTLNIGFEHIMKPGVKYLTWVSSDNIYYPDFIKKLRDALIQAPPHVGLSFSSFIHVDNEGVPLKGQQYQDFYKYQDQPKDNLLDACFIGVSFMYTSEAAAKINGYRLEPVEDYDYWLRITEHCDIVYIPDILMEYRTNAPMSISAQLQNSIEQHRRWRFAFQTAKHEARIRRNIPFQLTVIYPVTTASEQTLTTLEALFEQFYSNYKVIIVDTSTDASASEIIQRIYDPRVKCLHLPGLDKNTAVCKGILEANTPYTLLYESSPAHITELLQLIDALEHPAHQNDVAASFSNQSIVLHREINECVCFQTLYRTNELLQLVTFSQE